MRSAVTEKGDPNTAYPPPQGLSAQNRSVSAPSAFGSAPPGTLGPPTGLSSAGGTSMVGHDLALGGMSSSSTSAAPGTAVPPVSANMAANDTPFDMSEFPALRGGGSMTNANTLVGNELENSSTSAHSQSSGQRYFGMSMAEMGHAQEFAVQSEEFPALPGTTKGGMSEASGKGGSQTVTVTEAEDKQTQYGLLGLLGVIRMTDPDLNTLALGSDLTTLGLNLNSSKCLYATFSSPWAEGPSKSEPQYQLPTCYYMQQTPPLKHAHLQKFQKETLFYIFYAMPKDLLQVYAARELYNREWTYHGDLKLWFRKTQQQGNPHGVQYQYFDLNAWECRVFSGSIHGAFANGFMTRDEVVASLPAGN